MFDFLKIKVSMTTFLLSVDSYLLIFSAALFFCLYIKDMN